MTEPNHEQLVRRRARTLAAHARAMRTESGPEGDGLHGDPEVLAAARRTWADRRSLEVGDGRPQHLVTQALHAHASTTWARLALVQGTGTVVWSAGELPVDLVTAIEDGPQTAVLGGAEPIEVTPADARWPALGSALTDAGVHSIVATPVGAPSQGVLILAGTSVLDPAAGVVAQRLAAHAAAALLDGHAFTEDPAVETIDGARVALGHHLEIRSVDAFDVLLDTAQATGEPVITVAERLLAALVPRALADGPVATEPAALRRALSHVERHAVDPIGIDDLADAAGIGPRGVQQLFRQYRDTTPLAYLREVRLDRAHAELLAARSDSTITVGAIAARWHFTNPGRFSVAYRERFGVSPSITLRS